MNVVHKQLSRRADRRPAALAILAVSFGMLAASTATASGLSHGMRFCDRPAGPGNYVAATPNVPCSSARHVSNAMMSKRCIDRRTCGASAFYCRAHWPGTHRKPFSFTHHGTCHSGTRRWVEFDWG